MLLLFSQNSKASATHRFLLDEVTSLNYFYGFVKAKESYGGPCFRIRRSSDNAETDVNFVGNQADWANAKSFCGSSNGFVVTFYEQNGTGYHQTQATTSWQFQVVFTGNTQSIANGQVYSLGGTGKYYRQAANISPNTPEVTGFFAGQQTTVNPKRQWYNNNTTGVQFNNGSVTNRISLVRIGIGITPGTTAITLPVGSPFICVGRFNNTTTASTRVNNSGYVTASTGYSSGTPFGQLGITYSASGWNEPFLSLAFACSAISFTDCDKVFEIMNTYYGCY